MNDLYALDFDEILYDNCGESSLSAVKVLLFSIFVNMFGSRENKGKATKIKLAIVQNCWSCFLYFLGNQTEVSGHNGVNYIFYVVLLCKNIPFS